MYASSARDRRSAVGARRACSIAQALLRTALVFVASQATLACGFGGSTEHDGKKQTGQARTVLAETTGWHSMQGTDSASAAVRLKRDDIRTSQHASSATGLSRHSRPAATIALARCTGCECSVSANSAGSAPRSACDNHLQDHSRKDDVPNPNSSSLSTQNTLNVVMSVCCFAMPMPVRVVDTVMISEAGPGLTEVLGFNGC